MADTTGIFVSSDGEHWSEYRGQGVLESVTADHLAASTNYEVYAYYSDGNRTVNSRKRSFRTLWTVTKTDERVSVSSYAYPTIYTSFTTSDTISSVAYTFGGSTVSANYISGYWTAEVQREATTGQSNNFTITLTSVSGDTTVLSSSFTPSTDSVTIGTPTVSQVDWMTFNVSASVSPTAANQTYSTKAARAVWKSSEGDDYRTASYNGNGDILSASNCVVAVSGLEYEFSVEIDHYGNHTHYSSAITVYVPNWEPSFKTVGNDYIDFSVGLAPDFVSDVILHVYDDEKLDNEVYKAPITQSGEALLIESLSPDTDYYFQCVSGEEQKGEVYKVTTEA